MALVISVVSVKGEELLCILQRKLVWEHVGQRGIFTGRFYDESGSFKSGKKRKLKAAITRQLNELAGRVAAVSSGVEARSLEEMESIKATLERLETIKEKTFEILEELRTLYQQQKDTERQVKLGDEADELNERIEGEASVARRVLTTITRSIHPVNPPSYSSNSNTSLPPRMVIVVGIIWKEFAF